MSRKFHRDGGLPVPGLVGPLTRRRFIGSTGAALLLLVSRTGQADRPFVLVDPATRVIALVRPE